MQLDFFNPKMLMEKLKHKNYTDESMTYEFNSEGKQRLNVDVLL